MRFKIFKIIIPVLLLILAASASFGEGSITVTSPSEGDTWLKGTSHEVSWTSEGISGTVDVKIGINDGGSFHQYDGAKEVPIGDGKFTWEVLYELPSSVKYQVQIIASEGRSADSGLFSIADNPAPYLKIRAPAGGEAWAAGHAYSISWQSLNVSGSLSAEILRGDEVLDTVPGIPIEAARFSYKLPKSLVPAPGYSIRLKSESDPGVFSESAAFNVVSDPPAAKKWTVMIYLDADNGLEEEEMKKYVKLSEVGADSEVNIVAQIDRTPTGSTDYGNWYDTKRFVVEKGALPTPANAAQDLGELNMGYWGTLADFLCWGMENYPGGKYLLIVADHGNGWKAFAKSAKAHGREVCIDDTNGEEAIPLDAFQLALDAAPSKVQLLTFDACSQGFIEVAYQLRGSADIMIGGQGTLNVELWAYDQIVKELEDNVNSITARELSTFIVELYIRNANEKEGDNGRGLGSMDLKIMDDLIGAVNKFTGLMIASPNEKEKIKNAADKVKSMIEKVMICEAHGKDADGHDWGLDINFPVGGPQDSYSPSSIAFVKDTGWRQFLETYRDTLKDGWIGDARRYITTELNSTADLSAFCRALSPGKKQARLSILCNENGGNIVPQGNTIMDLGIPIEIFADPANDYHFVRWDSTGNAKVEDVKAAKSRITIGGDSVLTAVFSPDKASYTVKFEVLDGTHGSISGETTQSVKSGGASIPVTAVPDPGYVFIGWTGDYSGSENPLQLTDVISDMMVSGVFAELPETDPSSLKFDLTNIRGNSDKLLFKGMEYPDSAPDIVASASLVINNVVIIDCPAGPGWKITKPGIFIYSSLSGVKPNVQLKIDTLKNKWEFSAQHGTYSSLIPQDDVLAVLKVNGIEAAKISLDYDNDLNVKTSVNYKRSKK